MTLTGTSPHASTTASISAATSAASPSRNAPTLITMSISRAVVDRERGLAGLHVGAMGAVRKADDARDDRVGSGQRVGRHPHVTRLHAVAPDSPLAHDVDARAHVGQRRFGLQHRMVEQTRELGARHRAVLAAR
jgi:hypothetical protein